MVLFGIRSCDVQGITHTDQFFSGKYLDNYYLERRQKTTIISMTCAKPLDTCFCICCNGGPSLEQGFDLQLTDFDDRFLVENWIEGARSISAIFEILPSRKIIFYPPWG